jgi:hypothetical protein
MENIKKEINVPTRHNRLVEIHESLDFPVKVLAGISGITLAVAIMGFTMAKLGITNYYYVIFGVVALLAIGLAFFWEKTITKTWQEFTRQVVNWEFEGNYQRILGVFIFVIPIVMALISVGGSIFGGYEIAEVTAGEAETIDVNAVAASLSLDTKQLDNSYSQQITDLRNDKAQAIKRLEQSHNTLIVNNRSKAISAKNAGKTADYEWLNGGKASKLLSNKNNAIAAAEKKYDAAIDKLINEKNSALNKGQEQASTVLGATINSNDKELEEHQTKKSRHEIGFTWLAAFSSPLYLLLIFLSSLIEANIGAISQNDLISDEERTRLKQRVETKPTHTQSLAISQPLAATQQPISAVIKVPQQTQQQTVTNTVQVVFDYSKARSNLKTYLNRLFTAYTPTVKAGVKRYAEQLTAAGFRVEYIDDLLFIDDKNNPTLPLNSEISFEFKNNQLTIKPLEG